MRVMAARRLIRIWVDGGEDFLRWVFEVCWWTIEVIMRKEGELGSGLVGLPRRWSEQMDGCTGVVVSMWITSGYPSRQKVSPTSP